MRKARIPFQIETGYNTIHMVNIVGSYENKHWTKYWSEIKSCTSITPQQRALIIGSLLGDGTMRIGKKAVNANFKVEHGLEQEALVRWKYTILQSLVHTEPKISYRNSSTGERYQKSWWFRTIRHPLLTEIYDSFYEREGYRTGRKIIPKDIARDLNPQALAVWIMDDGSYNRDTISISTHSFSIEDIQILQKVFKQSFNVIMRFHNDMDRGYRMYANKQETKKLVQVIHPYIIPSMVYKIGIS